MQQCSRTPKIGRSPGPGSAVRPGSSITLAAAIGLALAIGPGAGCGEPAPEALALGRPPVVLIVLDALGADHVHHLGYERETTPALDALAAEGVSFPAAFASAPYTLASIPSILTGRRPDTHGVTNRAAMLLEGEETLAEALGRVGYRTRAVVANLNGGANFGAMQGFDEVVELYEVADGRAEDFAGRGGLSLHIPSADEMLPYVERWLAEDEEGPLFMYLHVLEPHSSYDPPAEFRRLWVDPDYDGPFVRGESTALVASKQGKLEIDDADRQAARDLYDANLRWADHNVGLVFDQLRESGLYDEALIVVTSDHGEAFWQHDEWGHNEELYDEALRIPLIVKFPEGVLPAELIGSQPTGLVSSLDIMPSIAVWLDLPLGDVDFDGIPLGSALSGAAPAGDGGERQLYLRSHHRIPHVALRTQSHKTIVKRHEQDGTTVGVEYYWIEADPGEQNNLSRRRAKETGPTIRQLEDWIQTATVNRARRDIPLTVMEQKMLQALGYDGD